MEKAWVEVSCFAVVITFFSRPLFHLFTNFLNSFLDCSDVNSLKKTPLYETDSVMHLADASSQIHSMDIHLRRILLNAPL